jgi:hypothetical protein
MRVFERVCVGTPATYKTLPLSSQTFCDTEDVLNLMQRHVALDGTVETRHIDFENMRVPICHQSELRVVAQLAAAYNISLVAENIQHDKEM